MSLMKVTTMMPTMLRGYRDEDDNEI